MWTTAAVLALGAGTAATTITKAKAFQQLRVSLRRRSTWLGYLLSCPYCASHWLVAALQAVYGVRLLHSGLMLVDVIVSSFAIVGAAALVPALLCRLYHFAPDPKPRTRITETFTVADVRPFLGHVGGEIDVVGMVPMEKQR